MIRIRCADFKQAAKLASQFSKLYSDGRVGKSSKHEPAVSVDGNTFTFVYSGKPNKNETSVKVFINKYLAPQKSQPV